MWRRGKGCGSCIICVFVSPMHALNCACVLVRAFIDIMNFPASYPKPDLCPDLKLNPSQSPTLKPRNFNLKRWLPDFKILGHSEKKYPSPTRSFWSVHKNTSSIFKTSISISKPGEERITHDHPVTETQGNTLHAYLRKCDLELLDNVYHGTHQNKRRLWVTAT